MDTQQDTFPVDQSQPGARPAPQPAGDAARPGFFRAHPEVRVPTPATVRTVIGMGVAYVGNVSECDVADVPELPRQLTVSSPRHYFDANGQRDPKYAGMVELLIGGHAYLIDADDLAHAVSSARDLEAR